MEGKSELERNSEPNEEPKSITNPETEQTPDPNRRKSVNPQKIIVPDIFQSPVRSPSPSKRRSLMMPLSFRDKDKDKEKDVDEMKARRRTLTFAQSLDSGTASKKEIVPKLRLDLIHNSPSDTASPRTSNENKPKSLVKSLIHKFTQSESSNKQTPKVSKRETQVQHTVAEPTPSKKVPELKLEKLKTDKSTSDSPLSPRNKNFVQKSFNKVGKALHPESKSPVSTPTEAPRVLEFPPMTPRGLEPMTPRRRLVRKQPSFITNEPVTPENVMRFRDVLDREEHRLRLYEQQLIRFEQELMKKSRELEEQRKIFAMQQHSFFSRRLSVSVPVSGSSISKGLHQDVVLFNNKEYDLNMVKALQQCIRSKFLRRKWMSLIKLVKDHSSTLFVRLRHETLKEIISTEKTHVQGLEIVKKFFLDPLRESKLLSEDVIRSIFLNIEEVLNFNSSLLAQLQERISSSDGKLLVGDIFIEKASSMQMYEHFITNLDSSIHALIKVRKNPEIDEFFQKAKDASGRGLNLEDYMIYPVQRLPRYELLLAGLKKYTTEDNIDYKNLCIALERIKDLNDNINDMKAVQDSETKINNLQELLIVGEEPIELKHEGRGYLREGFLTIDNKKYYCILLTDVLMITKRRKNGMLSMKGIIDMSTVVMTEPEDIKDITTFNLISQTTDKMARFSATTVNEKTQWMQSVNESMTESFNQRQSLKMKNRRMSMAIPESMQFKEGQLLQDLFGTNDAKEDLVSSYLILKEQVERKDRKGVLFTEKNCFIGTEAVECLVRYLYVDRIIARCMCEDMRLMGFIKPVSDKKVFVDSASVYYKFVK